MLYAKRKKERKNNIKAGEKKRRKTERKGKEKQKRKKERKLKGKENRRERNKERTEKSLSFVGLLAEKHKINLVFLPLGFQL